MNQLRHHLRSNAFSRLGFAAALFAGTTAMAHVTLPPGGAAAGSDYEAAFRVGHACEGAKATTGITVQLPDGFAFSDAQARKGWALSNSGREVAWKAQTPGDALPATERAEFIVRGKLTTQPGPLYFKVLQTCDTGSADWAQLPTSGTEKQAYPAARLDVLAPGVAAVDVRDAWVRQTVPGQSGTGAFMKLTAPAGERLDAGRRRGRGARDEAGRRHHAHARRAGRTGTATAPNRRAQAQRLPPHADRPEAAAAQGQQRAGHLALRGCEGREDGT